MKKVIITGATGGIGEGIAQYLASKHYDLILTARREERLKTLQAALKAEYHPVDFNNLDSISEYRSWIEEKGYKIDGIVIVTPRPSLGDALFPESDQWFDMFQHVFVGPLELIKQLIPYLNEGGKIVIISGFTSVQYIDRHSAYGVLRMMWLSQAKAMSYELGPKGISVNSVSLGGVLTERCVAEMELKAQKKGMSFDQQYAESIGNVPLRKYARPEDIGSTVEFLLSDQSNHVTGANLVCDGGFTRSY